MNTSPTYQSWWQELNDPGVVPRLNAIIQLLQQMADNLAVERLTATPVAASGTASGHASSSGQLIDLLPSGTVFTLPETLQRFNELVGAAGLEGALPVDVTQTATVNPGATKQPLSYQVPPGTYAIAMASFVGRFSRHSPAITLTGFRNYYTSEPVPITEPDIPVVQDFTINRVVTGSHEITHDVTILVNNLTPYVVRVTFSTVFLLVQRSLWEQVYQPIFQQGVATWIAALARDARALGKVATGV